MLQGWVKSRIGGILTGEGRGKRGRDARGSDRFAARNTHAAYRWQGEGSRGYVPIKLVNISRSGLLLVADTVPPDGVPVQVRFDDRRATCLDARVVHVARTGRGPHWVRIAFASPCPEAIIASVIGDARTGINAPPGGLDAALALLGLDWPCSLSEIKAALRLRSKELHPDLGGTDQGFVALREAFDALILAGQPDPGQTEARGPAT